jgi:hypothetical protein
MSAYFENIILKMGSLPQQACNDLLELRELDKVYFY